MDYVWYARLGSNQRFSAPEIDFIDNDINTIRYSQEFPFNELY